MPHDEYLSEQDQGKTDIDPVGDLVLNRRQRFGARAQLLAGLILSSSVVASVAGGIDTTSHGGG